MITHRPANGTAGAAACLLCTTPSDAKVRGRFAPSPTGRMHLGNVYAALLSYVSAKSQGGEWLLRIEDIDTQRSKTEWAERLMDDLDWLGLGWDGDVVWQSRRFGLYETMLGRLDALGLLYPCRCTRQELATASAPHAADGHAVYNGRCRMAPRRAAEGLDGQTLRLMVPPLPAERPWPDGATDIQAFDDAICGPQRLQLSAEWGDFVVRRRDGAWAYQFCAAVDDALTGITEIVRGDDLLRSTAPQRYVQALLRLPRPSRYAHIPLLLADDGRRLSKRDASLAMDVLRSQWTATDLIARICGLCGLDADRVLALAGR